jgi:predicted AlkP superfamily pyrophosphatase or phosphodiesterase
MEISMPRWLLVTIAIIGLLLAVAATAFYLGGMRVGDVGQLLSEGAIKELRGELRPPRSAGARVLVIAIDGVGDSEIRQALREGRVPRIASLIGETDAEAELWPHAYAPRGALSILPSTTYAAWTAVFTGEPVAIAGVPGNEWFDRTRQTFVAPAPVSFSEYGDAVRVYAESLLDAWIDVPTLFERADVRSYASLLPQHRGADLLIQPDFSVLRGLVTRMAEGVTGEDDAEVDTYSALDKLSVQKSLEVLDEYGLADLMVVYLPGVDLYTHAAEPALPRQVDYLADIVDPLVGDLLDAYDRRGVLDDTFVVFVSDHGHTPTIDDERNALGTGQEGEWPSVLEAAGFRMRPFEREPEDATYQAVFAYQGAFAYLYLADRSSCEAAETVCDWARAPRFEEDVLHAVRRIDAVNRGEPGGLAELAGTLDLIFAREPRGLEPATPFQVWDGTRLVDVADYLAQNPRPDLLELEARLAQFAAGPLGHRVGDVLLLSLYRFHDPIEQRYYFSTRYRSWHGSPSAQDSEITWILARRNWSGDDLRELSRAAVGDNPGQLDITPLVLELLQSD